MECDDDGGVYLWGAWTDITTVLGPAGYHCFVTWEPLDNSLVADVFERFWSSLRGLRDWARREGLTFALYHWGSIEPAKMRAITQLIGDPRLAAEVEEFLGNDQCVDLLKVVRREIVTGGGYGLKEIAPLAGFHWRDSEAGGDQSMLWYERAIFASDVAEREANRDAHH